MDFWDRLCLGSLEMTTVTDYPFYYGWLPVVDDQNLRGIHMKKIIVALLLALGVAVGLGAVVATPSWATGGNAPQQCSGC